MFGYGGLCLSEFVCCSSCNWCFVLCVVSGFGLLFISLILVFGCCVVGFWL